jgi:NAD(P) transhydrogenase subunit alpha
MRIAVLKELAAGETRVAATPETVKKFIGLGGEVAVEVGAGEQASIADADYSAAGASVGSRADTLKGANIILAIRGPDPQGLSGFADGAWLAAGLNPFGDRARIDDYAKLGLEALAMEFMPRITRAQSMDILSSQANLAGYKAVLIAANAYGRAFPMMMTAAGTVSAAKAFVMGVGVAGLQAIATARRLGAQVSAYATEMSDEYKAAQAELVSSHIAKQDIVITTALIPGRPAPRLISDAQLATMRTGSVIVDMAAESGGNVEGSVSGEAKKIHGVTVIGASNIAALMPADTSALFSRNLFNFLSAFWDKEAGKPVLDEEIGNAVRLTRDGKVVNERLLG